MSKTVDVNVEFDLEVPGHIPPEDVYNIISQTTKFLEDNFERWNDLNEEAPDQIEQEIINFCDENNFDYDLVTQIIGQIVQSVYSAELQSFLDGDTLPVKLH